MRRAVWRSGLPKRANSAGVVHENVEAEGSAAAGGNAADVTTPPVERAGDGGNRSGIATVHLRLRSRKERQGSDPRSGTGNATDGHFIASQHQRVDAAYFIGFQMTRVNDL